MGREYRTESEIRALFDSLGVEYLPRPRFGYEFSDSFDLRLTGYYRANRRSFERLERRYGPEIERAALGPVYIAEAAGMGLGLFAAEALPKGTLIGEYTGIVRAAVEFRLTDEPEPDDSDEPRRFPTDYAWGYPECLPGPELEIDAAEAGNELRFVNHSFRPNLAVEHTAVGNRWAVFFIASRRIRPGEQLLADYGEEYWSGGHRVLVLV
jgi:hypothetical protein